MHRIAVVKQAIDVAIGDLMETPEHVVSSRMLVSLADAYNSLRTMSVMLDAKLIGHLMPLIEIQTNDAGEVFIEQTRSQVVERFEQLRSLVVHDMLSHNLLLNV